MARKNIPNYVIHPRYGSAPLVSKDEVPACTIDSAHCTRCVECRKKDQGTRLMHKRYQELIVLKERTNPQSKELKQIAIKLYKLGYIRNPNKLNIDIGI
tara:strand:+ start:267 stop:563 length:297 start_codon:yes stop_codon:yes gene_type:complete